MPGLASLRRLLLRALAVAFAAATTLYSAVWMFGAHRSKGPTGYLGIEFEHSEPAASIQIVRVREGSPAERAGLRPGDRIVAIGGQALVDVATFYRTVPHGRPGDRVPLALVRQGALLSVEAVLGPPPPAVVSGSRRVAGEILNLYPVLFLIVSVAVVFLRPDDRDTWLLALVFAGFIAAAPFFEEEVPPSLRGFALAYKLAFSGTLAALFVYFFSVFPAASPLDRRAPWLKRLWLAAGLVVSAPLALWALAGGGLRPILAWAREVPEAPLFWSLVVYYFGGFGLGFLSLAGNALRGPLAVRRKSRVIVWGTLAGLGPMLLLSAAAAYARQDLYDFPFWVWAPCVFALFLIPLSFAYAVVKHRVLEIPVLLRRSARYLLVQRGSIGLLLLVGAGTTLLFATSFARQLQPRTEAAVPAAIGLGAAFGTVLVWAGTRVQRRVRERIDRAFFRSAYDARHILHDLAEKARAATSREDLAAVLEHHVRSALLPRSLVVYLESREGRLDLARALPAEGTHAKTLPPDLPALAELARRRQPWEVRPGDAESMGSLATLEPDCLVPVLGRDGRLIGFLVLGGRLSEEPYSGEDKRLLASVASQAGIALESIRLAEEMAERLEAERLAAHEMDLAKQVQSRLLPQAPLVLPTLECVGRCVQARAVGGDYYDFLDLGPGRVGLVLADISGKGFPAALLMANLQASLRSRSARDMLDLPGQLASVNLLLYRSSESNRYATLFLGIYDEAGRRLCYANCGHNPPLILRADGSLERLTPTAPVLGLFEEWECATREARLGAGDLLALYTDGVTEAFSDHGEEFGEARLAETLRAHRDQPLTALLDAVIAVVRRFSGSEQEDDLTLVLARGR